MKSGWCLTCISFDIKVWRIIHQFPVNITETQRAVPLMSKSLSGPPARALSGEICFSASYWEITGAHGVWESPASYSDPVRNENKVWSGGSKRVFFKTRFAKLCFVTSTGCSFWKNIIVFKSRATPSASQALWVAVCPRESVCYLRPSELFGRFWLHPSWSPMVQEHKVHLCPSRSRRKSLEIINNSKCSIKRFLE